MIVTFNRDRFIIPFIKNLVFEEFFFHKVHLGENVVYWESTNKPFALCFYKSEAVIDLGMTISRLKYLFYFLIHAFSFTKNITFFSIGGLPHNPKTRLFESISTFKTLQNPYIVGWLNGLLTNFPKVVSQFWLTKHKNKSEFKKEWFFKSKKGLKNLLKFPDFFIFFSIRGPYSPAFREACKFSSPIIAFLDTDSPYYNIQFPIGGNDDSLYSLKLYVILLRETIIRGLIDKLFDILTKNFLWRFKIETMRFILDVKQFLAKSQFNLSKSLSYVNTFDFFVYDDVVIKEQYLLLLKKKTIKNYRIDKKQFLALKNYFPIIGFGNLLFYFMLYFERVFVNHDSLMIFFSKFKMNKLFSSNYGIFRFFFFYFRYNGKFLESILIEDSSLVSHLSFKQMAQIFNLKISFKRVLKNLAEKKQKNELKTKAFVDKNTVDYSEEFTDYFVLTQNFFNSKIFFKKDLRMKMIISSLKKHYRLKYLTCFQKSKIFLFVQRSVQKINKFNKYLITQFKIFLKKQSLILKRNVNKTNSFAQIKMFKNLLRQYRQTFFDILKVREPLFAFFDIEENENDVVLDEKMLDLLKKRYELKRKKMKTYLFHMLKKTITKLKMKIYFKKEILFFKKFLDKAKKNERLVLENTKDAFIVKRNISKFFSTKKSNLRSIQPYMEFTFLR